MILNIEAQYIGLFRLISTCIWNRKIVIHIYSAKIGNSNFEINLFINVDYEKFAQTVNTQCFTSGGFTYLTITMQQLFLC